MDDRRLIALIPAAGRSLRMGRSKPLLPLFTSDFIGTIVATLGGPEAGVGRVLVVHRADDEALVARLAALAAEGGGGPPLVLVPVPGDADMLASIRAGWGVAGGVPGALVWPVDAPLTSRATVLAVLRGARDTPWRVVRPVHRGQPGHPLWVPAAVLSAAVPPDAAPGLRGLVDALAPDPLEVPVLDAGCLVNLNTPEAYAAVLR